MNTTPAAAARPHILSIARSALIAGSVAALTGALEIYVTMIMPAHGSIGDFFRSIADIACGSSGVPFDPALFGVLAHWFISFGWAFGYADLASRNAALSRAPWISGTVFGLVVFLGMQSILLSVQQFHAFTPIAFLNNVVLHTAFFGIPIALIVARLKPNA